MSMLSNREKTLYLVTDRRYLKENETLLEAVEQSILGGVRLVQLREKKTSIEEFIDIASKLKVITDKYNVPLIINDNIEVCKKVDASGVHIGKEDMELSKARQILGKDKIIGVSCKTVDDAILFEKEGASYLGVGAVNATSTKLDARPIERETLKKIVDSVNIPVFAIGGIDLDNIDNLKGTKIDGVAVVSGILKSEDKKMQASKFIDKLNKI